MRYNYFYPFQQVSHFSQMPTQPPASFLAGRGFQQMGQFKGIPNQAPSMANLPSKMDSFLQSADKLFATAQQVSPYIQQAAPMVKNLPSLFRLYKGFQGLPDANTTQQSKQTRPITPSIDQTKAYDYTPKPSKPRIFQPPLMD